MQKKPKQKLFLKYCILKVHIFRLNNTFCVCQQAFSPFNKNDTNALKSKPQFDEA